MQLFDHFPVGIMKMSCLLLLVSSVIVMYSPCSSLITSLSVSWRCSAYCYLCHQWLSCALHAALWSLPCRYHEDVLPTLTCVISDCHVLSMQLFDNFSVGIMKMSCLLLLVSSVIVMYSPCSSLITSLSVSWRCSAYCYLCHQWLSCALHAALWSLPCRYHEDVLPTLTCVISDCHVLSMQLFDHFPVGIMKMFCLLLLVSSVIVMYFSCSSLITSLSVSWRCPAYCYLCHQWLSCALHAALWSLPCRYHEDVLPTVTCVISDCHVLSMQLFDHFPVGIMKMSCLLLLVSSVIVMCSPCSSLITSLSVSWRCPAYFYLCHQWLSCALHAALWSLPCRYHEDVLPTFTCVISDCHVLSMQLFDHFPVGIMKMSCLLLLVSSVIVMCSPCSSLITSLSVSWRCPAYSYLCHQWLSCTLHAALWSLPCRYHEDVLPTVTCVISDCHVLSMQLFDNFPVGIMKMSCLLLLVSSVIVMCSPCSSLITSLSVSWRCSAYCYLCHQWLSCTFHAALW